VPWAENVCTSNFNVANSLAQALDVSTKIGLLLAHGSNFGWMPFLSPPITCLGLRKKHVKFGQKMLK